MGGANFADVYSRGDGGRGRAIAKAAGATYGSADERKLDHMLAKEIGPLAVIIEANWVQSTCVRCNGHHRTERRRLPDRCERRQSHAAD